MKERTSPPRKRKRRRARKAKKARVVFLSPSIAHQHLRPQPPHLLLQISWVLPPPPSCLPKSVVMPKGSQQRLLLRCPSPRTQPTLLALSQCLFQQLTRVRQTRNRTQIKRKIVGPIMGEIRGKKTAGDKETRDVKSALKAPDTTNRQFTR